MDIHNTIEDIVVKYLEEILSYKDNVCKCEQCKTDMICYALNRIKPMYVVSSRGIIHTENKKREYRQDEIDIYSTVSEAIRIISNTTRHEIKNQYNDVIIDTSKLTPEYKSETGCFFNFPQIIGRVFESTKLDLITDAVVTLYYETGNNLVDMFNKSWSNPSNIIKQMNGTFSFWPAPIPASKAGIQKDFYMYLEIKKENFQPTCKFFFIRLVSNDQLISHIEKENLYYINDIFINPKGKEGLIE